MPARYEPAKYPSAGLTLIERQLHAIVKSVYAMLHPEFDAILRREAMEEAPQLWNLEWASTTGTVWAYMAGGVDVQRLVTFSRGGVVQKNEKGK